MDLATAAETVEPGTIPNYNVDVTLEISYKILYSCLHNDLKNLKDMEPGLSISCLKSRTLKRYVDKIKDAHKQILDDRSPIVQDLFVLHQTANSLTRYNTEFLGLSYPEYRARVLYPNIIYMLIRILTNSRKFLQTTIKSVYAEICRKSYGIIYSHINTFYLDQDVIKTDVLHEFLGNGLRKFNPLEVDNISAFYKSTFRSIFNYYFRKEKRVNTIYDSVWEIEQTLENMISMPVRLGIYRDVLYDLQTRRFYEKSPTMTQLSYNYKVFKNVIVSNEFQDVYFSTYRDNFVLDNNEYKLMKFYNDDIEHNGTLEKIKKLPTIYKLLKCVHVINPNCRPYNEMLIKPKAVKLAVMEELIYPFRNMFNDSYIHSILDKVAENFTSAILSGEYVNLFSLSTMKIDQITFIQQLKKFINICLTEGTEC
jgi:hypothetical protein